MRAKRASELRYVCNFTDNFQTLNSDNEPLGVGCCVGSCVVCVGAWVGRVLGSLGRVGVGACVCVGCVGVCWGHVGYG